MKHTPLHWASRIAMYGTLLAVASACGGSSGNTGTAGSYIPAPLDAALRPPYVRFVHAIADRPPIRFCLTRRGIDDLLPTPSPISDPDGIPLGDASAYVPLGGHESAIIVRAYRATDLDARSTGSPCPSSNASNGADPTPLLRAEIPANRLIAGTYATVGAAGFATQPSTPPSICGAGYNTACATNTLGQLIVSEDFPQADPAKLRVKVLHGVPNVPLVDVCWTGAGSGVGTTLPIATSVGFATGSDYRTLDVAMTGGELTVHERAANGTDCAGTELRRIALPLTSADKHAVRSLDLGGAYTWVLSGTAPSALTVSALRDAIPPSRPALDLDAGVDGAAADASDASQDGA